MWRITDQEACKFVHEKFTNEEKALLKAAVEKVVTASLGM